MLITVVAVLAMLGAGIIVFLYPFSPSSTKVILIPRSQTEQGLFQLTAVTGTPDLANRQIPARIIPASLPVQSTTTSASGSVPATQATGILIFKNTTASDITLQSTILIGNSGVPVTFHGPITVPASFPGFINVPGFAVNPGASGNILQLDVNKTCCVNGIFVKNEAFSGGQDVQQKSRVQQSDIDQAANALNATFTQSVQANLNGQVKGSERVVDHSTQCQLLNVHVSHQAGDVAKTVTVTAAATCHEELYDYQEVRTTTTDLLQAQVTNDPHLGNAYALDGQVTLTVQNASVANADGQVDLTVVAQGRWVYTFSAAHLRQLANQIAGQSEANARAFLLQQAGVSDLQFDAAGNLPAHADAIQIVIKMPPGLTPP